MCRCTTKDCLSDGKRTCEASTFCYVQYTPRGPDQGHDATQLVRGCMDDRTPILCENRRPQIYTGSWPVLHCCQEAMCNAAIVPTLPPWAVEYESKNMSYILLTLSASFELAMLCVNDHYKYFHSYSASPCIMLP